MSYASAASVERPVADLILPRLWTPPLLVGPAGPCGCGCVLTPETSFGFDLDDFARLVLGVPLDPWERWLGIHLGELLPDGRPRFRTVLALVARQNGKSTLARALILYWLFVELTTTGLEPPIVMATSTDRSYAKKFWRRTADLIQRTPALAADLERIRLTISEEAIVTTRGAEYWFAANNSSAGRSATVNRALIDEVRAHRSLDAWGAITGAMNAVPDGQVVCISNQGDSSAILLDMLREPALAYIETGEGDPRLGLFEWSAPPGCRPTDPAALRQANPNYGHRVDPDALLGAAARAERAGGEELAIFRTEVLCQRVALLDPAVDPDAWGVCGTAAPVDLAEHRDRVACCLDVSLDGLHATLVSAAHLEDITHLDVVRSWEGRDCLEQLRQELPELIARIRPRALGWLPAGPAAALAATLAERRNAGWPPRRVKLTPITADITAVCMGLPPLVVAGRIRHGHDPLLTAHVTQAQRQRRGDAWVFGRRGSGPVDAAYAAAGAVHLARTLPPPPPPLTVAR